VGIEITAPDAVSLERLNALVLTLREPPLTDQEFRPARAA
jgi:hypothetical protein